MSLSAASRETLVQAALQARSRAYDAHSHFRVGAALMCVDGTVLAGASVDNASYGASTCAEQTAIVNAVSQGKRTFVALAVASDALAPIPPCGTCRQVVQEFCEADMPVLLVPGDYPRKGEEDAGGGGVVELTVGTLSP